jgi:hypothetical protein
MNLFVNKYTHLCIFVYTCSFSFIHIYIYHKVFDLSGGEEIKDEDDDDDDDDSFYDSSELDSDDEIDSDDYKEHDQKVMMLISIYYNEGVTQIDVIEIM